MNNYFTHNHLDFDPKLRKKSLNCNRSSSTLNLLYFSNHFKFLLIFR